MKEQKQTKAAATPKAKAKATPKAAAKVKANKRSAERARVIAELKAFAKTTGVKLTVEFRDGETVTF